jgi:hypothetical protein
VRPRREGKEVERRWRGFGWTSGCGSESICGCDCEMGDVEAGATRRVMR